MDGLHCEELGFYTLMCANDLLEEVQQICQLADSLAGKSDRYENLNVSLPPFLVCNSNGIV